MVKSSNSALRKIETYEEILKNASEGILIVNKEGNIEFLNDKIENMFGYSRKELLNQKTEILLPFSLRQLHTKHRRKFIKDPKQRPMGHGLKLKALRKDKYEFPVEISLSYLKTNDNLWVMAFITDISERIKAENQLKFEQERAQKYLDVAEVMVVALNAEGKITMINHKGSKIFGYNEKELIGKNWFDICIPKHSRNKLRKLFDSLIYDESDQSQYFENPILTKSGEERIIAWHKIVLRDETGKPTGALSSGEDITEIRNAEKLTRQQQQQLMQADKMASIGILVSGVAHEINNPNNYILLNGKIISRVWEDVRPILQDYYKKNGDFALAGLPYTNAKDKIGKLISGVSDGAIRIQKIVQSLKDFARQDHGDFNEQVDINKVVESAIIIVDNLIKKSTDKFEIELGGNIPFIIGNSQQLEQVIINFITNSCQALENKNKHLKVSTSYDENSKEVIIVVDDEGIGVNNENLKHIMDPFFTTKRDSGGTGLGIPVSYNIIKNHGGEIDFSSKLGEGTKVKIVLPE